MSWLRPGGKVYKIEALIPRIIMQNLGFYIDKW